MANLYVSSVAGSNTAPYDTWAKGAVLLATAASAAAAGDDIWVASDHAESSASAQTITLPGTAASPCRIISVNRAGSAPPVAADILAGASVTTTGANAIAVSGAALNYIYGITFNAGTGGTSANLSIANSSNAWQSFEQCAFNLLNTASGSRILLGNNASSRLDLNACTVSFGATGQGFTANGPTIWRNKTSAITGATIPTSLFAAGSNVVKTTLSSLDLSAATSGKTLVAAGVSAAIDIVNCKLDASVTIAATPTTGNSGGTRVIGSHSTTNVRRDEIYTYPGTLTTETTIKRTAGASDGTTAFTWKVVTTANAKRTFPFETFEGAVWNTSTGSSKTLTIHTVTDNVTLTDAEIWVEVEYLGSSATPVTTLITDANATVLTTAANQASDSGEAWTTTGLTTPVKQALAVTFTPQMIGPIRWKVKVAKASTTVYIDPNVDVA